MANRGADNSSDQEGNKKKKKKKKWVKKRVWINSCAACKHWEKRCIEGECEFEPHFPAERMEDFLAVQRVFEMSNVSMMLKGTDPVRGGEMAKSLIWEANCWKDDPVHGPLGQYNSLCEQISDKDQIIQLLSDLLAQRQQQEIITNRNAGLIPLHHNLQYHRTPMLFQENNAMLFQAGGYNNVPWGSSTFPLAATSYNQNPVVVQENATFQAGGYMPPPPPPPHHHLQLGHRAPMLFQQNATFQGGYNNVASGSTTFPPATAYNQNQNPFYNSYA